MQIPCQNHFIPEKGHFPCYPPPKMPKQCKLNIAPANPVLHSRHNKSGDTLCISGLIQRIRNLLTIMDCSGFVFRHLFGKEFLSCTTIRRDRWVRTDAFGAASLPRDIVKCYYPDKSMGCLLSNWVWIYLPVITISNIIQMM